MAGDVTNDPSLVQKLVHFTSRDPTTELIRNLDAKMSLSETGNHSFPVSLSDKQTCQLCSPSIGFVSGALAQVRQATQNNALQKTLSGVIKASGPLVRATGIDHQIQLNNWLFSANPVPDIDAATAQTVVKELAHKHPSRAIVMRSLNDLSDKDSIASLQAAGFQMLPMRQVYLIDPAANSIANHEIQTGTQHYAQVDAHDFSADDWTRAAMLYDMYHVGRSADLPPQYTPRFLAQAHQIGLLQMIGLRGPDDRLDGVIGLFAQGRTILIPVFGYDTSVDQDVGLERLLSAIAQTHAADKGLILHLGTDVHQHGLAVQSATEFTAVYVEHLSLTKRTALRLLRSALTRLSAPVIGQAAG